MNNKGFAVSGIIYAILILFIILLISLLSMFNSRKTVLDELKEKVLNQVGSNVEIKEFNYTKISEIYEYKVQLKGYYNIQLNTAKGFALKTNIYLNEGEKIYLRIYNNNVQIFSDKSATNLIMRVNDTDYKIIETFNNKYFLNTEYLTNTGSTSYSIDIKYIETARKNKNMNEVRYIKDCVSGNNKNNYNRWAELIAIVKGENVSLNKEVKIYDKNNNEIFVGQNLTDYNLDTLYEKQIEESNKYDQYCAVIDLGRTYNLDYLYSYHDLNSTDKRYYGYDLSVSSADIEYKTIYNYENNNVLVSAFENPKTQVVGNVYVPVKEFDKATWLRLYHFNNLNGTVYWDAQAQVLSTNGYDSIHKKSVLYFLDQFLLDDKYELLLEYPEYNNKPYIRWIQTSDFTKSNSITGYKKINVSAYDYFYGLKLSGQSHALITTTGNKYYEIGSFQGNRTGGIYGFNSNDLITNSVDLWVRIG